MSKEPIEETQVKEEISSVDLAGRVLLLETKVLFLETKLSVVEKKSIEEPKVLLTKPQVNIYGANRKPKSIK